MSSNEVHLNHEKMHYLLCKLGERLSSENQIAEIAIFGGSALTLLYDFRDSTLDVDIYPITQNRQKIMQASQAVAADFSEAHDIHLANDWLNDAIEIFVSDTPAYQFFGEFPVDNPGVRVFIATPEYIFSMKMLSMRNALESQDMSDLWHLADKIGINSIDDAKLILNNFFPDKKLPRRHELLLMDMLQDKEDNLDYEPMRYW